ncbi:hypothetical protein BDY17DRAFT_295569 [Neohortaea acidophila]|uniref:Uncharacterized protein n=1 Tax=Neohortaea acidophila TaxID=245834 RepID=A0A6A6PW84_9PEZI|nr:uncharacterized protein BDY17DRAFT_295569 [Neohortaea acidophila]KAF2484400.1 hypothetical protein BDY17DRAFT_295569 [Neohortaea acidophila]
MDPNKQMSRKMLVERACKTVTHRPQQSQQPNADPILYNPSPPAYCINLGHSVNCDCYDCLRSLPPDGSSDDEDEDDESPLKVTINAEKSINGHGNLVPTTPPGADAAKISALLLQTLNQINNAATAGQPARAPRRPINVDLTINCGIKIVGDKNVIGHMTLTPKVPSASAVAATGSTASSPTAVVAEEAAVAGAKKRKAEHDGKPSQDGGNDTLME